MSIMDKIWQTYRDLWWFMSILDKHGPLSTIINHSQLSLCMNMVIFSSLPVRCFFFTRGYGGYGSSRIYSDSDDQKTTEKLRVTRQIALDQSSSGHKKSCKPLILDM